MEKLLLYCTKATPYLVKDEDCLNNPYYTHSSEQGSCGDTFNGKIVAMCECDLVEEIAYIKAIDKFRNDNRVYRFCHIFYTNSLPGIDIQRKTCLSENELISYFKPKNHQYEKCGYALHLSNLNIFDKPKELSEYFKDDFLQDVSDKDTRIHKAPQNMMYVYDKYGNRYILLPIKPQYLCKILNGEKTIEVRRKIVNKLKELIR